jgi:protein-tyrosine phosphatase
MASIALLITNCYFDFTMTRVLFVCLGNICRSPAAEGILRELSQRQNLEVFVDSVGTGGWHVDEPPDARMCEHAKLRGYDLSRLKGRQFDAAIDFENFNLILTMDNANLRNILALDKNGLYKDKIRKTTSFCRIHEIDEVPDPYYKGDEGFEHVLDILEDACTELIVKIQKGELK